MQGCSKRCLETVPVSVFRVQIRPKDSHEEKRACRYQAERSVAWKRCPSPFFECKFVRRTRTKKKGRVVIKQSEALLGNGARLRFSSANSSEGLARRKKGVSLSSRAKRCLETAPVSVFRVQIRPKDSHEEKRACRYQAERSVAWKRRPSPFFECKITNNNRQKRKNYTF